MHPADHPAGGTSDASGVRLSELIAALSLATDLGMGQPLTHALRTCLIALSIGRTLGFAEPVLRDTYYTTLLRFVGCTSDSHEFLDFAAGEDVGFRHTLAGVANGTPDDVAPQLIAFMTEAGVGGNVAGRVTTALTAPDGVAARSMTAHCEVASMLAARLGLEATIRDALAHAFERWDGHGFPDGQAGEAVAPAVRLAMLARDVEVLARTLGLDAAHGILRQRRGRAHDPRAVDAVIKAGTGLVAGLEHCDTWTEVLRCEPGGPRWVPADRIDDVLTAFADFADVKMPHTLGHSRGVAQLCEAGARTLRFSPRDVENSRRAALLHDLGRTAIPNAIWERPGPLSLEQWERVRLHAYYSERILNACEYLRPLSALAGGHHERLDGSGYHRGLRRGDCNAPLRLLAAADACQAMRQARPHRPARTLDETADALRLGVAGGQFDPDAVDAVLAAAGAAVPRRRRAGGLTDREVQVLRLMARGASNKQIAGALGITPKTAGHHVQHIYDKVGCSTRAAAALFAVEHALL